MAKLARRKITTATPYVPHDSQYIIEEEQADAEDEERRHRHSSALSDSDSVIEIEEDDPPAPTSTQVSSSRTVHAVKREQERADCGERPPLVGKVFDLTRTTATAATKMPDTERGVVPDGANFMGDNLYTWIGERVWKNPKTGFEKVYHKVVVGRRYTNKSTQRESIFETFLPFSVIPAFIHVFNGVQRDFKLPRFIAPSPTEADSALLERVAALRSRRMLASGAAASAFEAAEVAERASVSAEAEMRAAEASAGHCLL
jgi:hypothetical protein